MTSSPSPRCSGAADVWCGTDTNTEIAVLVLGGKNLPVFKQIRLIWDSALSSHCEVWLEARQQQYSLLFRSGPLWTQQGHQ